MAHREVQAFQASVLDAFELVPTEPIWMAASHLSSLAVNVFVLTQEQIEGPPADHHGERIHDSAVYANPDVFLADGAFLDYFADRAEWRELDGIKDGVSHLGEFPYLADPDTISTADFRKLLDKLMGPDASADATEVRPMDEA